VNEEIVGHTSIDRFYMDNQS